MSELGNIAEELAAAQKRIAAERQRGDEGMIKLRQAFEDAETGRLNARHDLAAEREVRKQAEKERDDARSNTVAGLSHRVLTSYGAPNHPGLTLLGRIEALADSRDRVIVARKQAEKERDRALAGEVYVHSTNPETGSPVCDCCGREVQFANLTRATVCHSCWTAGKKSDSVRINEYAGRILEAQREAREARDELREKVKALRDALKEPERCCETCTDTTCTLRCCDGHPDRNFPYWQGMPLEERVKRVLAATEGRDATPPEHDCAAWKQMKKRVDEIRDELGPERVPAAAVERIMKLEDNLEALRSYADKVERTLDDIQTGRKNGKSSMTTDMLQAQLRLTPVSEWSKIERDEWLLDLCEAHWDGMTWHPRMSEMPNRDHCPLCDEYGYTCQGCPLGSCQNDRYCEAVLAFDLLLSRASHEKTWREKAGAMIEHLREVRRGVVEGG